MYHCEANVLAIIPLSTSFPSDVNENTELQGVDTHVTQMNDLGQMASDVDLMADVNQNTRTTALQNSLVRNIKKKNRKEHKLPEYEYPPVLGRQIKPSDSGVVNEGKLKEAYEKGGDSAQVWTGPHVSNSVSFNDIRAIVKGLTLRGNVIDAYAEMLMYEQQTKAPKSADDEKSYIFSTLCLEKRIVNVNIFSHTKPAGKNILSNIFCRSAGRVETLLGICVGESMVVVGEGRFRKEDEDRESGIGTTEEGGGSDGGGVQQVE
ncbi:hypothetical protein LOK49_LG09G01540 [Camellia lanceoleosa]|uniref:Uncharacterized protein n=1 Tax=Camellia lanceoleosa TaxID=1840588 RepID=A0ACC0GG25_9ERIC|nr:hypothetical protein LOK49_LG09G01540 [Camellia lanceoleosa]